MKAAKTFAVPVKLQRIVRVFGTLALVLLLATVISKSADIPIDADIYEIITSGRFTQASVHQQILKALYKVRPGNACPPVLDDYPNGKAIEKFATDKDFAFTREYLDALLQVEPACLEALSKSHADYVGFLQSTDIEFGDLSTVAGNGIVMVGGGKFDILTLINVQWLRILGSTLPVEIFIGSREEYDEHFCREILPKFGDDVRCTLLWEHMSEDVSTKFNIKGYQYKSLALLISRFENILFLDADNMPVRSPDSLFSSDVFLQNGLVLWPDIWSRTTSPKYYEGILHNDVGDTPIRGQFVGKPEFNYHDVAGTVPNPASESGMILVNKRAKSKVLLLSLYYNIFGPGYYYPLFSQGGAGEGDKETFINAATVLKSSYYQVAQKFLFIGYHEDGFHSKALGQHDPVVDYQNSLKADDSAKSPARLLFMHLSYPKLIPDLLIEKEELKNETTGKHRRLYLGSGIDYDFELKINEVFAQLICTDYDSSGDAVSVVARGIATNMKMLQDTKKLAQQCQDYFIPHVQFLKETPV